MSLDDLVKKMRGEYLSTFPEKIQSFKVLLKNNDAKSLQNEFHKLRGSGKTYGFPEVSELASKIEQIFINDANAGLQSVPKAIAWLEEFLKKNT